MLNKLYIFADGYYRLRKGNGLIEHQFVSFDEIVWC